jgi:hypothetical protein
MVVFEGTQQGNASWVMRHGLSEGKTSEIEEEGTGDWPV